MTALVEDDDQRAGDLEEALRAVALLAQRALRGDARCDVGEGEDDAAAGAERPRVDPQPLRAAVPVDARRGAGDGPSFELATADSDSPGVRVRPSCSATISKSSRNGATAPANSAAESSRMRSALAFQDTARRCTSVTTTPSSSPSTTTRLCCSAARAACRASCWGPTSTTRPRPLSCPASYRPCGAAPRTAH